MLVVLALAGCQGQKGAKKAVDPAKSQPKAPAELVEIASLEDRRSFGADDKLLTWALTATEPSVRARALQALGRIQDPASAGVLVKGLTDPDEAARTEAGFAIGLLGLSWTPLPEELKGKLVDALKQAEAEEAAPSVKLVLLEALGRVGTLPAAERLMERLLATPEVQARAALSLGIAAKNGLALPAKAIPALALLLKRELPPPTRWGAAYALAMSKNAAARQYLVLCATDDASEVRGLCARGLGEVGTDVDAVTLKKLLDDSDYRVAIEATRSLTKLAGKCKGAACAPIGALSDLSVRVERTLRGDMAGGAQPLLMLAQAGLPATGRPLLESLRAQLIEGEKTIQSPKLRVDLANLECRLAAALDRISGAPREVLTCGNSLIPEGRRLAMVLQELAATAPADPARRVADVSPFLAHPDPRVKLAALGALGASKSPAAIEKVKPFLSNADLVLAGAAVTALGKLGDKGSIAAIRGLSSKVATTPELAPALGEALELLDAKDAIGDLEAWLTSPDATVRASAATALSKLKGAPVSPGRVERPESKPGSAIPRDAHLIVKTERGEIDIKLFTQDAPLTSLALYQLARKNFFKGLSFHRVVPGFVAQGGDPRGDGEGGPGFSIRCEVNRRPYVRGTVGMALSGKDTGGSQFFVTTSTWPHLDGRYTAFGEVVKGQEIVDSLLEGDAIVEIRATP